MSGAQDQTRTAVVFRVEGQRHAIPLEAVARVFRMVAITPAPQAHRFLLGAVDIAGQVAPVVNTRKLLGVTDRPIELSDQLIHVRTAAGAAVLWVDAGTDLVEFPASALPRESQAAGGWWASAAVLRDAEGLVHYHDPNQLLGFLKEPGVTGNPSAGGPA